MFHAITTIEAKVSFAISSFIAILFVVAINHYDHYFYFSIANGLLANIKLIATISATLAGFFITALSILLILPERPALNLIKKAGHFEDFPGFMLLSAIYFFLIMLFAFVNIISGFYNYLYLAILLFLLSGSIINSIISITILGSIVDYTYQ